MTNVFQILSQYNFWNKNVPIGFKRSKYLEKMRNLLNSKTIKVLIGQRRSGKSVLMRQIISELIEKGVNPENIFYLNLEIFAFDFIKTANDLQNLFDLYLDKLKPKGKIYIFLDEVQRVKNWEKFVSSYSQDYVNDYEIFITGSNSQLLSSELATLLSGRYVKIFVYPFDFQEFCLFTKKEPDKASFTEYLMNGGLPEIFSFNSDEAKQNYIQSLKDTIILRDIIQRYVIKDATLLERILDFLLLNLGNLTSIARIVKYFKSSGENVNFDTVSDYAKYLTDAFVLHKINRYSLKAKQILKREYKFYVNDLAFRTFLLGNVYYNPASYLENYVFLTLQRFGYQLNIGVLKDKEIDFVAQKGGKIIYIQVAYLLQSEKTLQREAGNLLQIKDNYRKLLVTMDDFYFGNIEGIEHVQAWNLERVLQMWEN